MTIDFPDDPCYISDDRSLKACVDLAVVTVTASNETFIDYTIDVDAGSELWEIAFLTDSDPTTQTGYSLWIDGVFRHTVASDGQSLTITTPTETKTTAITDLDVDPAIQELAAKVSPESDIVEQILRLVSDSAVAGTESVGTCQSICNDELPYYSNCKTITEQYECCLVDAQRAVCRRTCECDFMPWWQAIGCAAAAGTLYTIDATSCVIPFRDFADAAKGVSQP